MTYNWATDSELGLYLTTAGAIAFGAVASGALYFARRLLQPIQWNREINLNKQSVEVPGVPGARMSVLCLDGKLVERSFEDVSTFYEAVLRGNRTSGNGPCLGSRPGPNMPYVWISYNEVISRSQRAGAAFEQKVKAVSGLPLCVGIYAQNRTEYVLTELACSMYSMVIVPLYDTLGAEACTFIITQAQIQLIVCDKNSRLKSLLSHCDQTPSVHTIVYIEEPTTELWQLARKRNIELLSWSKMEEVGRQHASPLKPAAADNLYMICYTSGTTGQPKGAMITHRNLLSVVSGINLVLKEIPLGPKDILFSFLPLAHIYEQMTETYMFMMGAQVGFYQGDTKLLMSDVAELKPTLLPTVPRLLNRVYDKVMSSVNNAGLIQRMLFKFALSRKRSEIYRGLIRDNSIWDRLIFKKIRQSLGGQLRILTTGSAPLSPHIMDFLRCAVGCPVIEGYGQTECSAVSNLQFPGSLTSGCVGPPLPCNIIKLIDVPEMGYYADQQKGEVCIKGPNIFSGYMGQPDKTAETIDSNGWLHTGDIGQWQENGELKIIDRKKNIFKLAQGEYIAPEKIEMVYSRCQGVMQVFVHGDSLKSCCVAIVVPDAEVFPKLMKSKLSIQATVTDLCANENVKKAMLEEMVSVGKKSGLNSLEQVKDIHLHPEAFTVESGLLTPTFKIKRADVLKTFQHEIAQMYTLLD